MPATETPASCSLTLKGSYPPLSCRRSPVTSEELAVEATRRTGISGVSKAEADDAPPAVGATCTVSDSAGVMGKTKYFMKETYLASALSSHHFSKRYG